MSWQRVTALATRPWRGQYDGFGEVDWEVGTRTTRQLSNTKDQDVAGLVNEDFRYRDLETGSFLTRDPLGFVDGPNVYTYVQQNPWTKFDPEGLYSWNEFKEDVSVVADTARDWGKGFVHEGIETAKAVVDLVTTDPRVTGGNLVNAAVNYKETWGAIQQDWSDMTNSGGFGYGRMGFGFATTALSGLKLGKLGQIAKNVDNITDIGGNSARVVRQISQEAADVVSSPRNAEILTGAANATAKIPLWTSTKSKTAIENALGHWKKHGSEFPEFQNAKQYVEGAQSFFNSPAAGTVSKIRPNGDTLFYNPTSNTFGVRAADGVPRTMFRPTDGINYWNRQ